MLDKFVAPSLFRLEETRDSPAGSFFGHLPGSEGPAIVVEEAGETYVMALSGTYAFQPFAAERWGSGKGLRLAALYNYVVDPKSVYHHSVERGSQRTGDLVYGADALGVVCSQAVHRRLFTITGELDPQGVVAYRRWRIVLDDGSEEPFVLFEHDGTSFPLSGTMG